MSAAARLRSLRESAEYLESELSRLSGDLTTPRRLAVEIEPVDPVAWLLAQESDTKIYWRSRDNDVEIAACGIADEVTETLAAPTHPEFRYLGGCRFDSAFPAEKRDKQWLSFGDCRFVLPLMELRRQRASTTLAVNVHPANWFPSVPVITAQLRAQSAVEAVAAYRPPTVVERTDTPEYAIWEGAITDLLGLFESTGLDKVVLARHTQLRTKATVDSWRLLHSLRAIADDCTLFGFQFNGGPVFLGATPERLYLRKNDQLVTEALAGTRARGKTAEEDDRLALELADSGKEQQEHGYVIDSIRSSLSGIVSDVTITERPSVRKLARVQHLHTPITARLRGDLGDSDMLAALHPTAAVNGLPSAQASAYLRDTEVFDRGWYAGPVGWIGKQSSEFAVAIRSALVDGDRIHLYAGAGIVRGSRPRHEWDELEKKLSAFLNLWPGRTA